MNWKDRYDEIKVGDTATLITPCNVICDICENYMGKTCTVTHISIMNNQLTLKYNGKEESFPLDNVKKL